MNKISYFAKLRYFGATDRLCGVCHFFSPAQYPHLYDPATGHIKPNTTPHRLFRGTGWNLVLVIPLQDVPGHYCGVICIGREGRYPGDYVARLLPDENTRSSNAGFILPFRTFQAIMTRDEEEGNCGHIIAYNNPLHLIRTILNTQAAFGKTPSLIGWVDYLEKTPYVRTSDWSPFRTVDKKVFWLQQHDSHTLRTVVEQDGHVLLYDMARPYPALKVISMTEPDFRPNFVDLLKMEVDAMHWPHYCVGDKI